MCSILRCDCIHLRTAWLDLNFIFYVCFFIPKDSGSHTWSSLQESIQTFDTLFSFSKIQAVVLCSTLVFVSFECANFFKSFVCEACFCFLSLVFIGFLG